MSYKFGLRSERELTRVHPDLIRVMRRAINWGIMDFSIIEGVRSDARQEELYAQGRTEDGNIITWTLNSKHKIQSDGHGHAVDIVPYPLDWENISAFYQLRGIILAAAEVEGVNVRHLKGGSDMPHYEIKL